MKVPFAWLLGFMLISKGLCAEKELRTLPWQEFRESEAALQFIDEKRVDTNLISTAVFQVTNQRRIEQKLRPLKYNKKLETAAALQSEIMRRRGSISHDNPEVPRLRTLPDRFKAVGVDYRMAAENVATAFSLDYQSGRSFYTRKENGREIYSYTPGGKPIEPHSYLSFAEALVESWMNSPRHRKNILNPLAQHIGISCLPGKGSGRMGSFYCTQVFSAN